MDKNVFFGSKLEKSICEEQNDLLNETIFDQKLPFLYRHIAISVDQSGENYQNLHFWTKMTRSEKREFSTIIFGFWQE